MPNVTMLTARWQRLSQIQPKSIPIPLLIIIYWNVCELIFLLSFSKLKMMQKVIILHIYFCQHAHPLWFKGKNNRTHFGRKKYGECLIASHKTTAPLQRKIISQSILFWLRQSLILQSDCMAGMKGMELLSSKVRLFLE